MIVYIRFGVLIRCVLCTVVVTAIAIGLVLPAEPDQTSPADPPRHQTSTTVVEKLAP